MGNLAQIREEGQAPLLLQRDPVRCMQWLRLGPKYANIPVKSSGFRPDLRIHTSRSLMARKSVHRPAPTNLASLIRGLYGRVARQLKVDPSYVSRVARGERQSDVIETSLERELKRIMSLVSGRNGSGRKLAKGSGAKGKKKRVM
jgi:hypothetical protein